MKKGKGKKKKYTVTFIEYVLFPISKINFSHTLPYLI